MTSTNKCLKGERRARQKKADGRAACEVFEYLREPPYWVVRDADGYWLVPAHDGGWQLRTPFVGHVLNLRPLAGCGAVRLGPLAESEEPAEPEC